MKCTRFSPVLLALVLFVTTAGAQNNLLVNPGFDSGIFTNRGDGFQILPAGSTVITAWTVVSDTLAWGTTPNQAPNVIEILPKDGSFFLDLQGDGIFGSPYGGVRQTVATTVGRDYRLTFHLGTQQAPVSPATHGPVSVSASAGSVTRSFTFNPTGPGTQWGAFFFEFTATGASARVTIIGTATSGGAYIGLDAVSLVAVPALPVLDLLSSGNPGPAMIRLTGENGYRFTLEASSDLVGWVPVGSATTAGGFADFSDAAAKDEARRFYRAYWAP